MKRLLTLLVIAASAALLFTASAADQKEGTLTKVGQSAPAFSVTALDQQVYDLNKLKGKLVLINFFATWCGPCMAEMPRLEKDIWQKFKSSKFVVLAVGREHSDEELRKFQQKHGWSFPIAADPKQEIYKRYAEKYIPRNYLINAEGKIVFQSIGYEDGEFKQLVDIISRELAKLP